VEKLLSRAHNFPITLFKLDTFSTLHKNWAQIAARFLYTAFRYFFLALLLASVSFWSVNCKQRESTTTRVTSNIDISPDAININTATAKELEKLPHIGEALARRIVEFRENNGPFRRPEHLLLVEGISETRFRDIRPLVKIE